jgi:hypothetical protein
MVVLGPRGNEYFRFAVRAATQVLKKSIADLNEMDDVAGDGDAGTTIYQGAEGISEGSSDMNSHYAKYTVME